MNVLKIGTESTAAKLLASLFPAFSFRWQLLLLLWHATGSMANASCTVGSPGRIITKWRDESVFLRGGGGNNADVDRARKEIEAAWAAAAEEEIGSTAVGRSAWTESSERSGEEASVSACMEADLTLQPDPAAAVAPPRVPHAAAAAGVWAGPDVPFAPLRRGPAPPRWPGPYEAAWGQADPGRPNRYDPENEPARQLCSAADNGDAALCAALLAPAAGGGGTGAEGGAGRGWDADYRDPARGMRSALHLAAVRGALDAVTVQCGRARIGRGVGAD
jgi:hypothetical protein